MAKPAWSRTRVTKKYAPSQPGARKLTQRYGSDLVCVRHRQDLEGTIRYTTVELLVEQIPIPARNPRGRLLAVRLRGGELDLRRQIMALGGRWDRTLGVWWVTRSTATQLQLMQRVVPIEASSGVKER